MTPAKRDSIGTTTPPGDAMNSLDTMHYVLTALVIVIVWQFASGFFRVFWPHAADRHCMSCGSDTAGERRTRGSIWIELVLWALFIFPGVLYSLWRLSSRTVVCASCGD